MAIATRTESSLVPTITQASLANAIKQAFSNIAIGRLHDDYVLSSDSSLRFVYEVVVDASKTYGKVYLRVRVMTNLAVGYILFSTWDFATKTGQNGSSSEFLSSAFSASTAISINTINQGEEFKLVNLVQGSVVANLCFLNPANKPSWWDLNQWNYGFITTINTFNTFSTTGLNPYSNSLHDNSLNNSRMSNANLVTEKRDIQLGFTLYSQSSRGMSAQTSDDLVSIAATSTSRFDVVKTVEDKEYLILHNAAGGLGCRIK